MTTGILNLEILMKKPQNRSNCPFCNHNSDRTIIADSDLAFAIFDKYPVSPGHALIIPKKHCNNFFDLNHAEQSACLFLLNHVKKILDADYKPNGFNVGVNIGEFAGQTIQHAHIHLIPRYQGDIDDPRGGVRGVIPEKKVY